MEEQTATATAETEPISEDLFWDGIRSAILTLVDLIERRQGIKPRTAEIRQQWRRENNRRG